MQRIEIIRSSYYDSVTLMLVAKELNKLAGVTSSSLVMGTEANYNILASGGFDVEGLDATPNDLIIAVMGEDSSILENALKTAKEYIASPPWKKEASAGDYRPKSLDGALAVQKDSNIAVISVAGRYAGDLAMDCIDKGLNVMLFSDNVPLEKEIDLKRAASEKGLLVMGPDCGTVIIRGKALGFANACPVGPVGIVAAAGTGLQEVHVQLARRGVGTLHGIGTGGRDVKTEVGGITTLAAVEALLSDDEIGTLVVVGKPPAKEVEDKILDLVKRSGKPSVFGFIGGQARCDEPPVYICSELEETACVAAALAKGEDPVMARIELKAKEERLKKKAEEIGLRKGYIRGLFSGGTLCYEAQLVLAKHGIDTWSNAPFSKEKKLENSLRPTAHSIIDYGEDEFTQGRLHPMMDLTFRCERFLTEASDPEVSVILFDVVLGYGCNPDPASLIAEAVTASRVKSGGRIAYVASICGFDNDPQDFEKQKKILEDAGVIVCESNAQASVLAAFLLAR